MVLEPPSSGRRLADTPDSSTEDAFRRRSGRRWLTLWVIFAVFWTVATLLRVDRVWVPQIGWHAVLNGPWIWLVIILPTGIFGAVFLLCHRIREMRRYYEFFEPTSPKARNP